MTKFTHLQSWKTRLVQDFREKLVSIFTKSWRTKNILIFLIINSNKSNRIKKYVIWL